MEYDLFLKEVRECVEGKVGDKFSVEIYNVTKNNEISLDGLVIFKKGDTISPNIYLNSYFDTYKEGKCIGQIADEIISIYNSAIDTAKQEEFNVQLEFDEIRDYIVYRLVNYEKNKKMLEDTPHIRFLDLAVTFYCLVKQDADGIATIRITNELMRSWKTDKKALLRIAHVNTPKIFPIKINTMNEVIRDILMKEHNSMEKEIESRGDGFRKETADRLLLELENDSVTPMYIMTNRSGINGATTLIYRDVISSFAKEIAADLYILPSSIHGATRCQ